MLKDYPLRYELSNELHARPFPAVQAGAEAAFLAIKRPDDAANRDRDADRAHLLALLDRFGADHPKPGATHYFGKIGRYRLKWESHTEFVTYTLFSDRLADKPFDGEIFKALPSDWLAEAPGMRLTSALLRIEEASDSIPDKLAEWFVPESLAASSVLDDTATVAGDFRIDSTGHVRFALFPAAATGRRRIGRIVQRLFEIETYKTMSMLTLPRARELGARLGEMDAQLSDLVGDLRRADCDSDATLGSLLAIGSELETMLARSAFRFGAMEAYTALVEQRVEVLREERMDGRQTFAEFMMRRFDPAMRTCRSVEKRMGVLAERARRAGDLLSTRVNVERADQNRELLTSMDRRAALQLRLQRTVEGLSVVAIGYYAVNLVSYLAYPMGSLVGLSKEMISAFAVVPVVLAVWWVVRRIRERVES
ncbi:Uncharacterized membrane-anchored protein [Jannaschia faecimaris]|uniref:Uncharacterized membrane-anchored protein n=1 Tax=Jannaschia faecimaris TaxID=1244108 RepID=A0A1H3KYB9_9RHOB|nr:DUF3422 domain-containing protein [Jannaschia faecimaris]SDY56654.1 Uncharacterized membrane-anchored protein [Jannaschia faecimaris]